MVHNINRTPSLNGNDIIFNKSFSSVTNATIIFTNLGRSLHADIFLILTFAMDDVNEQYYLPLFHRMDSEMNTIKTFNSTFKSYDFNFFLFQSHGI